MKNVFLAISVVLLGMSMPVNADEEIYKDTGEEGEPVFSDIPTPGATEVDLPPENIADPVAPRPRSESEPTEVSPGDSVGAGTGGGYRVGGNDPMEDIMRAKQHDNKDGRKQGDGNREHELSDAEDRYNPSEADEQYNPSEADEQYNPADAGQDRETGAPAQHRGGGRGR